MGQGEQLDLVFLATGTWQHVFTSRDDGEQNWVYKIPSAFGYVLPLDHPLRYRPAGIFARSCAAVLARTPFAQRLYSKRLRALSLRNFKTMLERIEEINRHGLSDILLPCEIIEDASAALAVDDSTFNYRGPILKQRRADFLFERSENLRSFEWREIVEAHHRLWRYGITFSTTTAVLELKNWALLDGRLHLFDTSSLTRDRREVSRALAEEELNKREQRVLRRVAERESSEPLVEYFRFIRRELNRDKLELLWRSGLNFKH
ncbi:MAG TPA: hypothetical protein VF553_00540 [Pyrinomonadaceae bacterium]|jgi:hypothetical protein